MKFELLLLAPIFQIYISSLTFMCMNSSTEANKIMHLANNSVLELNISYTELKNLFQPM